MSEKSKNILLGVLIVGLVSMTVAYAALSTSLQINGTANVAATTWDIHFANVQVDKNNTTGASENSNGVITTMGTLDNAIDNSRATGTAFSGLLVELAKPGDKATITFDIVNAGTIDAKNTVFQKHIAKDGGTASASDTNDVVTYTITCGTGANGSDSVLTKSTGNNATAHCTLVVQYDNNAMGGVGQQTSQTAGQDQTVNQPAKSFALDASWTYVQN